MDKAFWIERWEQAQIGFHLPAVHPLLARHWTALGVGPGSRVFVPLCGKSVDLVYLLQQGMSVTGIELSPLAIRQFLAEQSLVAEPADAGGLPLFEVSGLRLFQGDFFQLDAAVLGPVDAVYDRAALIALPPDLQTRYAARLQALAQPAAPILLITFDYDPADMSGPPFATPAEQVRRLFGDRYVIEVLEQVDALADNPALQQRGLRWLTETAWRLLPR